MHLTLKWRSESLIRVSQGAVGVGVDPIGASGAAITRRSEFTRIAILAVNIAIGAIINTIMI